jgi:hypothetical protein
VRHCRKWPPAMIIANFARLRRLSPIPPAGPRLDSQQRFPSFLVSHETKSEGKYGSRLLGSFNPKKSYHNWIQSKSVWNLSSTPRKTESNQVDSYHNWIQSKSVGTFSSSQRKTQLNRGRQNISSYRASEQPNRLTNMSETMRG